MTSERIWHYAACMYSTTFTCWHLCSCSSPGIGEPADQLPAKLRPSGHAPLCQYSQLHHLPLTFEPYHVSLTSRCKMQLLLFFFVFFLRLASFLLFCVHIIFSYFSFAACTCTIYTGSCIYQILLLCIYIRMYALYVCILCISC